MWYDLGFRWRLFGKRCFRQLCCFFGYLRGGLLGLKDGVFLMVVFIMVFQRLIRVILVFLVVICLVVFEYDVLILVCFVVEGCLEVRLSLVIWIWLRGGGVMRKILGLWVVMVGCVMICFKLILYLLRGICWWFVGNGM